MDKKNQNLDNPKPLVIFFVVDPFDVTWNVQVVVQVKSCSQYPMARIKKKKTRKSEKLLLVGGWPTPLKKYEAIGMMTFPIYGKS